MQYEIKALETNDIWILIKLLVGKKAIASKWIFRIKYNVEETVNRYKVRLVAKGYGQLSGIDYHDSFSLVINGNNIENIHDNSNNLELDNTLIRYQ